MERVVYYVLLIYQCFAPAGPAAGARGWSYHAMLLPTFRSSGAKQSPLIIELGMCLRPTKNDQRNGFRSRITKNEFLLKVKISNLQKHIPNLFKNNINLRSIFCIFNSQNLGYD